jgi:hypothetical protein
LEIQMRKVTYTSLAILIVLILLGFLFVASNSRGTLANSERFYAGDISVPAAPKPSSVAVNSPANPDMASSGVGDFGASDPDAGVQYNPVAANSGGAPAGSSCFPRDRLSAEDLLPKDAANTKWSQANPAGQGDVRDQNFLTAGYHIGVQQVRSKNPLLDIRSEMPNPKVPVSPWNISTIDGDTLRRGLEIGAEYN